MPREFEYSVRPKATKDLDQQAAYYREHANEAISRAFLDAARDTFRLLATQPNMGWKASNTHPELPGLRLFRVRKFPKMVILYLPKLDGIDVLRVVHGSQDLGRLLEHDGHDPFISAS